MLTGAQERGDPRAWLWLHRCCGLTHGCSCSTRWSIKNSGCFGRRRCRRRPCCPQCAPGGRGRRPPAGRASRWWSQHAPWYESGQAGALPRGGRHERLTVVLRTSRSCECPHTHTVERRAGAAGRKLPHHAGVGGTPAGGVHGGPGSGRGRRGRPPPRRAGAGSDAAASIPAAAGRRGDGDGDLVWPSERRRSRWTHSAGGPSHGRAGGGCRPGGWGCSAGAGGTTH